MTTDLPVAVGTWVLAVATWALASVTWWLARRQLSLAKEQLEGQLSIARGQREIELYLALRKDFDGPLIVARKIVAQQFLANAAHDEIKETVLDFFEDMGMLIRRDYLDRDMVWGTFSYYARMWWSSCKEYIEAERARLNDSSFFTDFEYLVEWIGKEDVKRLQKSRAALEPSLSDIKGFLDDEAKL